MMHTRVGLEGVETPKEDWAEPLGRRLLDVVVFGSAEATTAAQLVLRATVELESGTVGSMIAADSALDTYRGLVQRDLGLPETTLPSWPYFDDELNSSDALDGGTLPDEELG